MTSHRLIDLAKAFGVVESTHRADDDVATTCVIYRLVLAAITQMPLDLVKVIAGLASTDMWSTGYIFKEMLKILPSLGLDDDEVTDDYVVPVEVYDKDLFGNAKQKVNTFGMLRTMRNERFQNLPKQKKLLRK